MPKEKDSSSSGGDAAPTSTPPESAPSASSAVNPSPSVASVPSVVKDSPQDLAQRAQRRRAALTEAHKLLSVDVRNSAEQVAHFCEVDNAAQIKTAYELLASRVNDAAEKIAEADQNL